MDQYIYKTFKILTKWAVLVLFVLFTNSNFVATGEQLTDSHPPPSQIYKHKERKSIGQVVSLAKRISPLPKGWRFLSAKEHQTPLASLGW